MQIRAHRSARMVLVLIGHLQLCEHGRFLKMNLLDPISEVFYTLCQNDKGLFGMQKLMLLYVSINVN